MDPVLSYRPPDEPLGADVVSIQRAGGGVHIDLVLPKQARMRLILFSIGWSLLGVGLAVWMTLLDYTGGGSYRIAAAFWGLAIFLGVALLGNLLYLPRAFTIEADPQRLLITSAGAIRNWKREYDREIISCVDVRVSGNQKVGHRSGHLEIVILRWGWVATRRELGGTREDHLQLVALALRDAFGHYAPRPSTAMRFAVKLVKWPIWIWYVIFCVFSLAVLGLVWLNIKW